MVFYFIDLKKMLLNLYIAGKNMLGRLLTVGYKIRSTIAIVYIFLFVVLNCRYTIRHNGFGIAKGWDF